MSTNRTIHVGLIGCGEISQVSHIATLGNLSDYFQITYLCDVSQAALEHCAPKVHGPRPKITLFASEVCSSEDVDAVLIANANAFHTPHAIMALQNNKHVLVEKPLALCYRDIDALEAAERDSSATLLVGYMRRYAPAFQQAMAEVGDKSKIQYARVRDIIGGNAFFVDQSGTFPRKFDDINQSNIESLHVANKDVAFQALREEFDVPLNDTTVQFLTLLGGLGSHDLSAMREAIGIPKAVKAASLQMPIWTALFDYGSFPVVYESGINGVPVFDAHIEIYTPTKIVRVNYDTPYVRGLPITVTVRELSEGPNGEQGFQERTIRATYEDTYTLEFKEWYGCIVEGRKPKTGIEDARQDVELFKMLMQSAFGGKA